jgi:hypothetical protein
LLVYAREGSVMALRRSASARATSASDWADVVAHRRRMAHDHASTDTSERRVNKMRVIAPAATR